MYTELKYQPIKYQNHISDISRWFAHKSRICRDKQNEHLLQSDHKNMTYDEILIFQISTFHHSIRRLVQMDTSAIDAHFLFLSDRIKEHDAHQSKWNPETYCGKSKTHQYLTDHQTGTVTIEIDEDCLMIKGDTSDIRNMIENIECNLMPSQPFWVNDCCCPQLVLKALVEEVQEEKD